MVIWDLDLWTERGWSRIGQGKTLNCGEGSTKPRLTRWKMVPWQVETSGLYPLTLLSLLTMLPREGLPRRQTPRQGHSPLPLKQPRKELTAAGCLLMVLPAAGVQAFPWRGTWGLYPFATRLATLSTVNVECFYCHFSQQTKGITFSVKNSIYLRLNSKLLLAFIFHGLSGGQYYISGQAGISCLFIYSSHKHFLSIYCMTVSGNWNMNKDAFPLNWELDSSRVADKIDNWNRVVGG